MKMKKSALALILAVSLISSSTFSFAATFNDMKNAKGQDHWSTPYVNDISSKGLVSGYADGSFKPNNPVTRIEAMVFISRLFPQDTVKSVYDANKAKWDTKLKDNLIPEFAKAPVVFGLEKKLYTEAYLKEFMNKTNKTQKNAQRYEFAVYLVRALGWQSQLSNAAVVKYKDVSSIPKQAVPYIELLGKKGVLAKEGDFNPMKSITRGEIGKMLSLTYKDSERAKTDTANPNPPSNTDQVVMPSGTIVEGKIVSITSDNNNTIVNILKDNGVTGQYSNRLASVIVSIDGKAADIRDVKEGYTVKLYADGITLKGVEVVSTVTTINKNISGEILSVSSKAVKIKDRTLAEEFDFASNVKVTKNGKEARVSDLVSGDSVDAKIQNSLAVSIDAKTVKRNMLNVTIRGVTSYANGSAAVIIQDENGNQYDMQFTQSSRAYLNSKQVGVGSLAVGYEADVYANSNEILEIFLQGKAKDNVVIGVITDINYRDEYLYVKKSSAEEIKVTTSRDTDIRDRLSGTSKSFDNLEKGQNVIINGFDGINAFDASKIEYYK